MNDRKVFRRPTLLTLMIVSIALAAFLGACVDEQDKQYTLQQSQAAMQHMDQFASQIESVLESTNCAQLENHMDSARRFREGAVSEKTTDESADYVLAVDDRMKEIGCL